MLGPWDRYSILSSRTEFDGLCRLSRRASIEPGWVTHSHDHIFLDSLQVCESVTARIRAQSLALLYQFSSSGAWTRSHGLRGEPDVIGPLCPRHDIGAGRRSRRAWLAFYGPRTTWGDSGPAAALGPRKSGTASGERIRTGSCGEPQTCRAMRRPVAARPTKGPRNSRADCGREISLVPRFPSSGF